MTAAKIVCLIVLAILMIACFKSDKIASLFVKEEGDKQQKMSLLVKGIVLACAVVLFLIIFLQK